MFCLPAPTKKLPGPVRPAALRISVTDCFYSASYFERRKDEATPSGSLLLQAKTSAPQRLCAGAVSLSPFKLLPLDATNMYLLNSFGELIYFFSGQKIPCSTLLLPVVTGPLNLSLKSSCFPLTVRFQVQSLRSYNSEFVHFR